MLLEFKKNGFEFKVEIDDTPILKEKTAIVNEDNFYLKINRFTIGDKEIDLGKFKYYDIGYYFKHHNTTGFIKKAPERLTCIKVSSDVYKQVSKILNVRGENEQLIIVLDGESKEKVESLFENGREMSIEVERIKKEKIKEADKKISDDDIVKIEHSTSYYVSIDGAIKDSFVVRDIEIKLNEFKDSCGSCSNLFRNHLSSVDIGDYTTAYYFEMKYSDLKLIIKEVDEYLEMVNEYKKEAESKNNIKRKELIEKAKLTGEKQLFSKLIVPCNDKNEECSLDVICEYIDQNGVFSSERKHTW